MVATTLHSPSRPARRQSAEQRELEAALGCKNEPLDGRLVVMSRSKVVAGVRRFRHLTFHEHGNLRNVLVPAALARTLEQSLDSRAEIRVHKVRFTDRLSDFGAGDSLVYAVTLDGNTFAVAPSRAYERAGFAWTLAVWNAAWWSLLLVAAVATVPLLVGIIALVPAYRQARAAFDVLAELPAGLKLSRYLSTVQKDLGKVHYV